MKQLKDDAHHQRQDQDLAIIDLLIQRLDPAVINIAATRSFLDRYGPFDPDRAQAVLDRLLAQHLSDQHVDFYLNAIRENLCPKETP